MTTTTKKARGARKRTETDKAVIQVRLDTKTKDKVAQIFKRHGLSTSDGMRMLINRAIEEKVLPEIPNAETRKALEEARAGDGEVVPHSELKRRILGKA